MTKELEVLESLDKLEECAYAMKDLPFSNWCDLAENEVELDSKIMNWVEEIKFELFKGKQALQRLEEIDNANPSEALKYVNGKIADLEDDLQHYTMVEKDKCKEFFIREDLKQFTTIKQTLLKAQEQEKHLKALEIIKKCRIKLEKREDFDVVSYATFRKNGKYRYYINDIEITQEEFDLLREVLENEQRKIFN